MDKLRSKSGHATVMAKNLRVGEWVHWLECHRRVWALVPFRSRTGLWILFDDNAIIIVAPRDRIRVNYPRPPKPSKHNDNAHSDTVLG